MELQNQNNENENEGLLTRDESVVGEEADTQTEDKLANSEEGDNPRFKEIERRLSDQSEDNRAGVELAKLLGDSDVRAVLEAKARGETVRLGFGDNNENTGQAPDLESLSQTELVQHLLGEMEKIVSKGVVSGTDPLMQRLDSVEGFVNEQGRDKLSQGIKSARERFSDFDKYQEGMLSAFEHPEDLTPEELYIVAKNRKGGFPTLDKNTSSEKPSGAGIRPAINKQQRKTPVRPGTQGFRQLLEESTNISVENNWSRED